MASQTEKTISLKLLVCNHSKKVLYAEAGKDFVDMLFGFLQIPLGSIIRLLHGNGMAKSAGSFARVYESVINLDSSFFLSAQQKDSLLIPNAISTSQVHAPSFLQNFQSLKSTSPATIYSPFGSPNHDSSKEVGYVKGGIATYMVMDDLTVTPQSNISIFSILNMFQVKDIGSLKEEVVKIDLNKVLELVKTSFESNTVLSDMFVGKD